MNIFNKIKNYIKSTSCPQCKSRKVILKKIQQKYIEGYDKHHYYCCSCCMIFEVYKEVK